MSRKYTVLLVDDEPWITYGLQKLVKWDELGFEVIGLANNGQQAWEIIAEEDPDVVVSDIRMPGLDGLTLLERIREEKRKVEVIMISGYADFEYAQKALTLGAFDYLLKQIKREALRTSLIRLHEKLEETQRQEQMSQNYQKLEEQFGSEEALLEKLQELLEKTRPVVQTEDRDVQKILDEIDKNYSEKLSLQRMAEQLSVSQGHLSNRIKQETGYTFTEHLTRRRINAAIEFLMYTEDSIAEIADKTGYTDYFSFIKSFKKVTGYTPSQYRKKE